MLLCSCELKKSSSHINKVKYCEYHKKQFNIIESQIKSLQRDLQKEKDTILKLLNSELTL